MRHRSGKHVQTQRSNWCQIEQSLSVFRVNQFRHAGFDMLKEAALETPLETRFRQPFPDQALQRLRPFLFLFGQQIRRLLFERIARWIIFR